MNTHEVTLPSSLTAEVRELVGKDQRLLTEAPRKGETKDRFVRLVSRITARIGDVIVDSLTPQEQEELFAKLPLADRKKLLVTARDVTYPEDTTFSVTHRYTPIGGVKKEDHVIQVPLEHGFPFSPQKDWEESKWESFLTKHNGSLKISQVQEFLKNLPDLHVDTVAELISKNTVVIPGVYRGAAMRFTILNGDSTVRVSAMKDEDHSAHTPLLMRNLERYDDGKWVRMRSADLDNTPIPVLEIVRAVIHGVEGRVDTEVEFEHPDAEYLPPHQQTVVKDMLGEPNFFFPSGAI